MWRSQSPGRGERSVAISSYAPTGLVAFSHTDPALTRWATFFRASGASRKNALATLLEADLQYYFRMKSWFPAFLLVLMLCVQPAFAHPVPYAELARVLPALLAMSMLLALTSGSTSLVIQIGGAMAAVVLYVAILLGTKVLKGLRSG